ncbi:MAG: ABC transporter substrate-binding protein [Neisseria sp.]|nr:ABC transporter substrate-binding protein [Neisseria sp.]
MNTLLKSLWTAVTVLALSAAVAAPQEAVNQIRTSAQQVLNILNKDNGANSAAVRAEAERYALPYFDFERMTALAVGLPWKNASADQKARLSEAFKNKLIRIYSGTMLQYKNAKVTINDNPQVNKNGREVIVGSEVLPNAGGKNAVVHIDYTMYQSGNTYRIYDIKVEGQSLVTVYRNQFGDIVKQKGIDGLITELQQENSGKK